MSRVAALLLGLAACAPQYAIDGRPYALGIPDDVSSPRPLIVLLHGFGVTGEAQDVLLPFSKDVRARKFFYALPNGTLNHEGKRFWNATDACCNDEGLTVDDVAFLRAVIADVKAKHPVDPKKVILIGHSNGGFMAMRMACDASDEVTAIVSLAGATWLDPARCPSGRPVSVLAVHGTTDDTILYGGGSSETGGYPSAAATLSAMAKRNGCTGARQSVGTSDFVGDATTETTREAFSGCPAEGRAELWTVANTGHVPIFNAAWRAAVLDWLEVR